MTDLEFALEHSRTLNSGKLPDIIPLDFGLDFHLETMPELYTEVNLSYGAKVRQVRLEISTFRGMCWEAIHYYGKLVADGVDIIKEEADENGKTHKMSVCGFICEEFKNMPNKQMYNCYYKIEIVRPVTQKEINKDPDRWHGYEAGWHTNGFESKEEIIKVAKKIVKTRFPGWEFKIEND